MNGIFVLILTVSLVRLSSPSLLGQVHQEQPEQTDRDRQTDRNVDRDRPTRQAQPQQPAPRGEREPRPTRVQPQPPGRRVDWGRPEPGISRSSVSDLNPNAEDTPRAFPKPYTTAEGCGRRLVLRGSVVLEGDRPFGEAISVEMVCHGVVVGQVFTGRNGNFYFPFGPGSGPAFAIPSTSVKPLPWTGPDATTATLTSYLPPFDFCELRVQPLLGYMSPTLYLFDLEGRFPEGQVGKLVLRRRASIRGKALSTSFSKVSKDARKAYFKANAGLSKEKSDLEEATTELEKAVRLSPDFAVAWNLLAQLHRVRKDWDSAEQAFIQAINADPEYIQPYLGLARLHADKAEWGRTLSLTKELRSLGADVPELHYLDGIAYYYLADLERAKDSLQKLDPELAARKYPLALLHMGIIHCTRGEVSEALSDFRGYLKSMPTERIPKWHRDRIQQQINEWLEVGLVTLEQAHLPG